VPVDAIIKPKSTGAVARVEGECLGLADRPEGDIGSLSTRGGPTGIPLFLISFRQRDELMSAVAQAGWQPIAARRSEAAEARFIASGAAVALIDARGAFGEGLAAIKALANAAEANATALVVLISSNDVARLDTIYSAGATHYLASPFGSAELISTLRFAARYVERLGGGIRTGGTLLAAEEQWWSWVPGEQNVMVSDALAARLGTDTSSGGISARQLLRSLDQQGRKAALSALRRIRSSAEPTAFAHDRGAADGHRIVQHLTCEQDGHIVGRIEDLVAERTATVRRRDRLTGLTDAPGLRRWLNTELSRSKQSGDKCTLLLLSISRFDMVNAAFGRSTGDLMLRAVARRIERLLIDLSVTRHVVSRLAGAVFGIGLSGTISPEQLRFLTEQLLEVVSRPLLSGDDVVRLSARIGLSFSATEDEDGAMLLRRASAALAETKAGEGSDLIKSLDVSEAKASIRKSVLEVDLRRALDEDQIEVLFQPQIALTSGKMIGVEALARWRHPSFGELGAVPLFAAAERSDFVVPLSAHIQRKALTEAAAHPALFQDLRVALNVTAADIAMPNFVPDFLYIVDASGIRRPQVTVEITETGLISDLARAAKLLAELRAAGLRVAIDDFGTGYSSLAYLKALPLDYLKIDRQLAQDITGSKRDRVVVKGVIEMARSLGLSVIAEGIETEEQLSLLAEAGANIGQGFLFSGPVTALELGEKPTDTLLPTARSL
jgi:diguanylate cyclase (GGDEF)-like protein